jgi:pimeloyl-ACP methyl ester carboxylesterase
MRVIAPDLRGSGESDKPDAVEEYELRRSVGDMVAVLDGLGIERAHVVGHDWGAVVAWLLAALVPDRVERLVAMSVGHPNSLRRRSIEQQEKSWYMLLFQFTGVAEQLLMRDDWKLFREWLRNDGDIDRYVTDLSRPGALTAGLNWYRANAHPAARARAEAAGAGRLGRPSRTLEQRRQLPAGRPHAALGGARDRSMALRTDRRRQPLDAARRAGADQRAPRRFPGPGVAAGVRAADDRGRER